jgi:hypothetical protein
MGSEGNTHYCAMMEKGGKCCENLQGNSPCVARLVFGAVVLAGLIVIIVLQAKTLKVLQKHVKKK